MSVSHREVAVARAVSQIAASHADEVDREGILPEHALAALRDEGLLGAMVPSALGGEQCSLSQIAAVCHTLAQSCGSTAMIYAMHQIQVACIIAHGNQSEWHRWLMQRLLDEQLLLGSATSEAGTGGNIHASICCLEDDGGRTTLEKSTPAISYGTHADGVLVTARRNRTAAPSDQVMVVALRDDYMLEITAVWDALGMRGTCSDSFRIRVDVDPAQILPAPFADIASQTMLPVSHLLWSSVWLGIATDAVSRARNYLRQQARSGRGSLTPSTQRLAKAVGQMQLLQARLSRLLHQYEAAFCTGPLPLGFTAQMNNLKVSASELCLKAVHHAFMVCGISSYKNGSEYSLGRHFRDLLSAPIMINNDRIMEATGNLLLMQRPDLEIG